MKRCLRLCGLLCGLMSLSSRAQAGDYYPDRRLAQELLNAGQIEEACAAFLALSESAVTPWQQADALEQAAMAAYRLGRMDDALVTADRIPLETQSVAVRMRIMAGENQWPAIVERFGGRDFSGWPRAHAAEAFYLRGKAYVELKQPETALPDLRAAARRGTAPEMFFELAKTAVELGDEVLAMDAWRDTQRALAGRGALGGWMFFSTIVGRANVLCRHGKYAYALDELRKVDIDRLTGSWKIEMLRARAQALAGLGRRQDALADCRRALQVAGINRWQREAVEKIMQSLGEGT